MKIFAIILTLLTLTACSSKGRYTVVESLDNKSKPSWASIGKTTWKEDGQVWAVGVSEGVEPDRMIPLFRISDNNAKTEITRQISNEVGAELNQTEEGLRGQGSYSFIGSEKSNVLVQELKPVERYYEKLVLKEDTEGPVKIVSYSLVSIPETTYNRLIKEIKESAKKTEVDINTISNAAVKVVDGGVVGSIAGEVTKAIVQEVSKAD